MLYIGSHTDRISLIVETRAFTGLPLPIYCNKTTQTLISGSNATEFISPKNKSKKQTQQNSHMAVLPIVTGDFKFPAPVHYSQHFLPSLTQHPHTTYTALVKVHCVIP